MKKIKEKNKTTRDYAILGHFIITQIYKQFDYHPETVTYQDLKYIIYKDVIQNNPCIDRNFAMHKYNHGNSKLPDSCTYRWENVFDFYVRQHIKAGLLYRPEANKAIIEITNPTFIALADGDKYPQQMFNEARTILRQQYEDKKNGR